MGNLTNSEVIQQEKILEMIVALKVKIESAKLLIKQSENEEERTQQIAESFQYLLNQTALIESESIYLFELSNCKHMMMNDNLAYIKKLEQEIKELKP